MTPKKIKHALFMAAGEGVRMRPLTQVVPKAMAPWKGRTLIAAGMEQLKHQGVSIHATVGYKASLLSEYLMTLGIASLHNTGGHNNSWWIHNTLFQYLDEPIYVHTCDNLMTLNYAQLNEDYYSAGSPACMLVPAKTAHGFDGDFIHHTDQRVLRVSRSEPAQVYCSGVQIINPARVVRLTSTPVTFYDIWNTLIAANQLHMSRVFPEHWVAIDTIEQLRMHS